MITDLVIGAGFTPAVTIIIMMLVITVGYLVVRYEKCIAKTENAMGAFTDYLIEKSSGDDPVASRAVRRIRRG